jgi:hypothetical protein
MEMEEWNGDGLSVGKGGRKRNRADKEDGVEGEDGEDGDEVKRR